MTCDAADACCSICGASGRSPLYLWHGYRLYRCARCGAESVEPLPTSRELAGFYQGISGKKIVRPERRLARVKRAFDRYLRTYHRLTGRPAPGRFADIGGGVGYYVRAAQDRGIDAWLVDWAGDAMEFAVHRLGVRQTVSADVQRCADHLPEAAFDWLLARHVIEHLRDPDLFVAQLARLLRRPGLVQIETPNVASVEQFAHPGVIFENARIIRSSNPKSALVATAMAALTKAVSGVNPPKHLWGFTETALVCLLERQDFEILAVRKAPAAHPTYDPLYFDLHRWRDRKGLGKAHWVWQRGLTPLFRGRGMNLVVFAQRR